MENVTAGSASGVFNDMDIGGYQRMDARGKFSQPKNEEIVKITKLKQEQFLGINGNYNIIQILIETRLFTRKSYDLLWFLLKSAFTLFW